MSPEQAPAEEALSSQDLQDAWPVLFLDERIEGFRSLPHAEAEDLFLALTSPDQAQLLVALPPAERRGWLRLLPLDDTADVVQQLGHEEREPLLCLLDPGARKEVGALLAYAEDEAGGLMNPRFARVRPDMTVDEAISYLRRQTRERLEMIYYVYVLDQSQKLLGVVSFRELFAAPGTKLLREVMHADPIAAREDTDQEALSRLIAESDLIAVPILDEQGHMKGIVTVDDIVDVVQEEGTEDIHKLGAVSALDAPYLQMGLLSMIRKRAGWLVVLFVGEMFTATAMGYFEIEIKRAAVLALFIPLIISSGGNSGSQASTLVVRALSLGEIRLRDWWRVFSRELLTGAILGLILGSIGFLRILLWPTRKAVYGEHFLLIGATVALSLLGVVLWGTLTGSMLPFLLRRLKLDPATASAPLVATLVDVTGLVLYFTVALTLLRGTLL